MDPRQKLFRKAALEKMASPERLDELMRITAPAGWLALGVVGLVLVGAVLWSIFGSIPVKVHGNGILIRGDAVRDVTADADGRLEGILVGVGEVVTKGTAVAMIGQPDLSLKIENTREELLALTDQTQTQSVSTERILGQLRTQKRDLGEKIEVQTQAVERGLVTRGKLLTTKSQLASVEQQIAQFQAERTARSNRVDDIRRELEELESRLTNTTQVLSPYTGRVLELMADPGNLVHAGSRLLTLEALDGAIDAIVYIPAGDGKKVVAGMETRISPSTIKSEEYGFILGTVRTTSEYPVTPEGMVRVLRNEQLARDLAGEAAQIEIVTDLTEDEATASGFTWSSSKGPPSPVYSGTICTASVIVEKRRPISYVLPILKEAVGIGS